MSSVVIRIDPFDGTLANQMKSNSLLVHFHIFSFYTKYVSMWWPFSYLAPLEPH